MIYTLMYDVMFIIYVLCFYSYNVMFISYVLCYISYVIINMNTTHFMFDDNLVLVLVWYYLGHY